ncbi:MAG: MFS transporter [Gammaproteobacteria bacterium]|nr:MFS transporter [Gammaproteobacteria bacterium]MDH3506790.1 MFS transporter [Gammaproteobacteria bacterium]
MSDQIRTLIDESKLTGVQITVVAVCFFLNMLDGMDVLAISFAAPAIAEEWSISRQSLGVVFSAALVGMTAGALVLSPLTDVIGRRKMILISLVMISLGMVATSLADSILMLIVLRFLAGLGIGSMLASMTSMVSEYAPDRWRNVFILVLHASYSIGAIIIGFVAAYLVPIHGWRPLFIVAGCASAVGIPLVWFLLPESLDFLTSKQPSQALERVNKVLSRMGHAVLETLPARREGERSVGLASILGEPFRQRTISLWLAFFMGFATLYFLLSWVVTLALEAGLALENAIWAGVCLNLGAFFGSVSLGILSNRFGLTRIIGVFFLFSAVFVIAYGTARVNVALVLMLVFLLMYFVQGAFTGLYAVAARLYPTEIRTTGIGWAIGAGRLGAIFGPIVAGLLLGAGVTIGWTFAVYAIPMILGAVFVTRIRLTESGATG